MKPMHYIRIDVNLPVSLSLSYSSFHIRSVLHVSHESEITNFTSTFEQICIIFLDGWELLGFDSIEVNFQNGHVPFWEVTWVTTDRFMNTPKVTMNYCDYTSLSMRSDNELLWCHTVVSEKWQWTILWCHTVVSEKWQWTCDVTVLSVRSDNELLWCHTVVSEKWQCDLSNNWQIHEYA